MKYPYYHLPLVVQILLVFLKNVASWCPNDSAFTGIARLPNGQCQLALTREGDSYAVQYTIVTTFVIFNRVNEHVCG